MHRMVRMTGSLLLGGLAAATFVTTAYTQSILGPASEANHFIETPKGWVQPKTAWGEPDITGMYPISFVGTVGLERCAGGGGRGPACDPNKAWLTEEEYKQRVDAANGRGDQGRQLIEQGNYGAALLRGVTDPTQVQRQTSLIVDPPNGRLPELTEEGKRRSKEMRSSWALAGETPTYDWVTDFDSWDRCITRGMPSSMFPYRYNNGVRIMQAPGMVVLDMEMIHESRIVYTDGRPPLPAAHKQYMGESRGRWEGNTLVVVTTNYKEGPSGTNIGVAGSPQGNRWPVSDQMKTTERFTRLNKDFILYEIKTEDPLIMTRPYTVRFPMKNDPTYDWWEYACHEGNTAIPNYVNTSRYERAHPAPPAAPAAPGQGGGGRGGRGGQGGGQAAPAPAPVPQGQGGRGN
jgi:hypothetical protein